MSTKTLLKLNELKDPIEREVILYINKNEQCAYGEIIRNLKLSYTKGQEVIGLLVSKGYIKFIGRTSNLELTGSIV